MSDEAILKLFYSDTEDRVSHHVQLGVYHVLKSKITYRKKAKGFEHVRKINQRV